MVSRSFEVWMMYRAQKGATLRMFSSNSHGIVILRGCDFMTFRLKSSSFRRICHPDRSEAQWRDLLFLFRFSHRIVILSGAPYRLIA
jgi:hypothetical protein